LVVIYEFLAVSQSVFKSKQKCSRHSYLCHPQ